MVTFIYKLSTDLQEKFICWSTYIIWKAKKSIDFEFSSLKLF